MSSPRGSKKMPPMTYRTAESKTILKDQERPVCFICAAEHPPYWAVAECSHRLCSLCALRLRALYGTNRCPMCKVDSTRMVVVRAKVNLDGSDHTGTFEELHSERLPKYEDLGISFVDGKAKEEVLKVLEVNCPVSRCRDGRKSWRSKQELKKHVSVAHELTFCEICLTHKKVFSFEYRAFNQNELQRHQREAHPACPICPKLFYSEDELQEHCRDCHEQCHICKRQQGKPAYYRDYTALEGHFRTEHYLCLDPLCLELKFVVFESDLEYKAHLAEMHLGNTKLQRSAQQQLRRLDTGITVGGDRGGDRGGNRGGNRGESGGGDRGGNRGESGGDRGLNREEANSPRGMANNRTTPEIPISKAVLENLVYGDAIGDLAQRMQSLSMYEQRNIDFVESLRRDHHLKEASIKTLREYCRSFQRGETGAAQLLLKLEKVVGNERLKGVMDVLVDLQLDLEKRMQIQNWTKTHLARIAAFPALPVASEESRGNIFGRGNTSFNKATGSASPVGVLRIRPATIVLGRTYSPSIDPSRNPTSLLGSYNSKSQIQKKTLPPPSFRQAIAAASTVGFASDGITNDGKEKYSSLDEQEFPSLDLTKQNTSPTPISNPGNVFTSGENRNLPESFVIGDNNEDNEMRREDGGGGRSAGRKKKGQILFRYG